MFAVYTISFTYLFCMQYLAQDRLPLEIKVQAKNYREIQKLEIENLKTKKIDKQG